MPQASNVSTILYRRGLDVIGSTWEFSTFQWHRSSALFCTKHPSSYRNKSAINLLCDRVAFKLRALLNFAMTQLDECSPAAQFRHPWIAIRLSETHSNSAKRITTRLPEFWMSLMLRVVQLRLQPPGYRFGPSGNGNGS